MISEIFGSMVFSDREMKSRLPHDTYKILRKAVAEGGTLPEGVADVVASAMKEWALSKGATHFTHWFQPLTSLTAEKHDSFISPCEDGSIICEFRGKELIKGEPDASSFPSGGFRGTSFARGYTAWDPSSPAFVKDGVLCIPTVFFGYTGESLDKKTPLLRSMEALNKQALRIVHLFGHTDVKRVTTTVGPEQEYFLIDEAVYNKRPDLIYTGRTLFGARPTKGQQLDDHYFGVLAPRVSEYMKELDEELWKLGILAKTRHNETAPAQHELAPIYSTTNVAVDHNQLTMEFMKKLAPKHGMACLLHEKPFEGVNGSAKHNNWAMSTDTGMNLMDPGATPAANAQFLLILAAVIKAVDLHQDLLRISVASAANDHRLGGFEAPPAIVSIFLGDELNEILESIVSGKSYTRPDSEFTDLGVDMLPSFRMDNTDRNRTSPFAFTGNKFEFRMLGSQFSVAFPNVVLNTIVASVLDEFANRLENSENFDSAVSEIVRETIKAHQRIIFNGDSYSQEWVQEAARRGLANYKTTPEALVHLCDAKNLELFSKYHVYTEGELHARQEILLDQYCKTLTIECTTMVDMASRDIVPAIINYTGELAKIIAQKNAVGLKADIEMNKAQALSAKLEAITEAIQHLRDLLAVENLGDKAAKADFFRRAMVPGMDRLRAHVDETELMMPNALWPYPSYGKMLHSVR